MSLSGLFQFMVRQSALVETYLTSVERLLYYGKSIEVEEEEKEENPQGQMGQGRRKGLILTATSAPSAITSGKRDTVAADGEWPAHGRVTVTDLRVRYRSDLPQVLNGISFDIPAGTKVGIVGRTGSGKSSLIQALFRLNEVSGGTMQIDGMNTLLLPLARLRSKLSLIPQEPALFTGTLRYNLDPFGRYTDADLWSALEVVGLRSVVGGLETPVAENGQNISTGQRQLVSLARAILAGNRIVVMDEATANVDYATDDQVQRTLREAPCFRQATIITIAHRVKTIVDADLILVFDGGRVVEAGPPQDLIVSGGVFADMVRASGQQGTPGNDGKRITASAMY